MTVRALSNQSWLDISLQYNGDAGQAYANAVLNGMNVSDAPPYDADVTLVDTIVDAGIVQYYQDNNLYPACKYEGNNKGGFLLQANGYYILQANDGKIQID